MHVPRRVRVLISFLISATTITVATPAAAVTCPVYGSPKDAGTISISGLNEVSGVVASRQYPVLWIHEDSGNPAVIYAIAPDGHKKTTVAIHHATNKDWEDIALAAGKIWLGDIGDNGKKRSGGIQVYWFPEPSPTSTGVTAKQLNLRYEDGPHNAEAMFVDARHDGLYIVTKEKSGGVGYVYRADITGISDGSSRTLRRVGKVPLGTVTAADLGPRGIIVKNYTKGLLYPWASDGRVGTTLSRSGCSVTVPGGESIAFLPSNNRLYAVPEGTTPPLRYSPPA
ncbi:MAG TPA: hypothetical protein VJ736_06000 [Actinomycetota bacterium]|jgi:hypothetical protein|nr:hypothetical protein [Actinomycetota bacterium]